MQSHRIAIVQLPWLGDRPAMQAAYRDMTAEAVSRSAHIVCLPELSLSPYFPGAAAVDPAHFEWAEPLPGGESERFFAELAHRYEVTIIGSLFEKTPEGRLFDTATLHRPDGTLLGITRKVHIPSGLGYNEIAYFEGGNEYPIHDTGVSKMAVPTCYDQWFPEMARISALNGAEVIFYPTAIGAEPSDPDIDTAESWQTVMRGHAVANGVYVAAANRIGTENGIAFYGSSFVCDPRGRIISQAGRDTTEVITADLDAGVLEHWRDLFPLLRQRQPLRYARLTES